MRGDRLVDEDLRKAVKKKRWRCACGMDGLRFSFTRKGKVQARCFRCGQTIFFNDLQMFDDELGKDAPWFFQRVETPRVKKLKDGTETRWYPKHKVRIFIPPRG